MRDIRSRVGAIEVATAKLQVEVGDLIGDNADKEVRLRKLEFMAAKVLGAAIFGSSVGGLLLSKLTDWLK